MANQTEPHFRGPVACRMADFTYRQLDYWARTGMIRPSIEAHGSGTQRRYSFREVVLLRMVRRLLAADVSLQRARQVVDALDGVEDLSGILVVIANGQVVVTRDADHVMNIVFSGGLVIAFGLDQIIEDIDRLPVPNLESDRIPDRVA